ncbi:MAG: hypothetical protein AAGI11_10690 [Pseudomonadota bacterium]
MVVRIIAGIALALGTAYAGADSLTAAADDLCEHVKSCAMAQMAAEEDLTPEMRQMVEPVIQNMCSSMRGQIQDVGSGHPLYGPSVACMRSMSSISCDKMMEGDGMYTDECKEYEARVKAMAGE